MAALTRTITGGRKVHPNNLHLTLIFLGATGVLTGSRALSDLRPSDSIGLGAIVLLGDFLVPYGVAAIRRAGRARWPVVGDLLLLAAISFLSFSKAAFITYAVIYGEWKKLFTAIDDTNRVTAADVQRVAVRYFVPTSRTMAYTAPGGRQ